MYIIYMYIYICIVRRAVVTFGSYFASSCVIH